MAFGTAVLEPSPDHARGAALVAAVAGWLHQPVPPAGPAAAPVLSAVLGDDRAPASMVKALRDRGIDVRGRELDLEARLLHGELRQLRLDPLAQLQGRRAPPCHAQCR